MTTSDYRKMLRQLKSKPIKYKKFLKSSAPKKRSTGKALRTCVRCGRNGAHINKYGLHLCRHCFREIAEDIGFRQYQ